MPVEKLPSLTSVPTIRSISFPCSNVKTIILLIISDSMLKSSGGRWPPWLTLSYAPAINVNCKTKHTSIAIQLSD
jgi:hypothetical protein